MCTDDLDITFEDDEIPEYVTSIHTPLSASAELSCECEINPELFTQITGIDLARGRDLVSSLTLECSSPYQVQKRSHKKKRINKKWAKRYGYRTKFANVKLLDVSVVDKHLYDDVRELEFVGRRAEIYEPYC